MSHWKKIRLVLASPFILVIGGIALVGMAVLIFSVYIVPLLSIALAFWPITLIVFFVLSREFVWKKQAEKKTQKLHRVDRPKVRQGPNSDIHKNARPQIHQEEIPPFLGSGPNIIECATCDGSGYVENEECLDCIGFGKRLGHWEQKEIESDQGDIGSEYWY